MIRARKKLGQNFLTDATVARRIVDAVSPDPGDIIVEIGPGTGALTRLLAEVSTCVVAVEIDPKLAELVRKSIGLSVLQVVQGDALKIDWNRLLDDAVELWRSRADQPIESPRVRIVANLPYNISTPIIEKLIEHRIRIHDMILMLQKEVVERITAEPGSREYGYLTVLVQYYAEAIKLFDVSPSAFTPAPGVWSAVLRLRIKERPDCAVADEGKFFSLVSAAFAQKRKTLLNNLKASAVLRGIGGGMRRDLEAAGIDPGRRAETLSIDEFVKVYRAFWCKQ